MQSAPDCFLTLCVCTCNQAKTTKASIRAVCIILDAFHFPLPHNLEVPQHAGTLEACHSAAPAVPQHHPQADPASEGAISGDEGERSGAFEIAQHAVRQEACQSAAPAVPQHHPQADLPQRVQALETNVQHC